MAYTISEYSKQGKHKFLLFLRCYYSLLTLQQL